MILVIEMISLCLLVVAILDELYLSGNQAMDGYSS